MLSLAHKQLISLLRNPPSRDFSDHEDEIYRLFCILAKEHGVNLIPGDNDFHFAVEIPILTTTSTGSMKGRHTQFLTYYQQYGEEPEDLIGPFRHEHFTDINRLYDHLSSFNTRWTLECNPYRVLLLTGEVFETEHHVLALFERLLDSHPLFSDHTYFNSLMLPMKHPLLRLYFFNNILNLSPHSGL